MSARMDLAERIGQILCDEYDASALTEEDYGTFADAVNNYAFELVSKEDEFAEFRDLLDDGREDDWSEFVEEVESDVRGYLSYEGWTSDYTSGDIYKPVRYTVPVEITIHYDIEIDARSKEDAKKVLEDSIKADEYSRGSLEFGVALDGDEEDERDVEFAQFNGITNIEISERAIDLVDDYN